MILLGMIMVLSAQPISNIQLFQIAVKQRQYHNIKGYIKMQKLTIDYTKDKEKLKISWKVDSKRKQKVVLESFKDLDKHFNVLETVIQQLGWKLLLKPSIYTNGDYNRLTGYQDQYEVIELQIGWSKTLSDFTRVYNVKDFSIPLVIMDLKKLLDKDIEIKAEFN
jgi:hypothetical protein